MTRRPSFPLYVSVPHPCSYLPGRTATTLFLHPEQALDTEAYGRYSVQGFRRSGDLIYRPHCQDCVACVSVRVPVEHFKPNRSQRRIWRKNRDLTVHAREPVYAAAHFDLFLRYQAKRHPGSGMGDPDPRRYMHFLTCNPRPGGHRIKTVFYEFRQERSPVAVAVVDFLPDGLSAVYTFYDPDLPDRGLGVYALLWQIQHAHSLGLPRLYLGYWIKESPKMAYKINYRPLEIYQDGRWVMLENEDASAG